MDEPFGALDPIIRAKAQDDLLAIQKRFGTTIVLVTHDMEEAIHLGDRIAVMDEGKLLQYARAGGDPGAGRRRAFVETLIGTGERPFRLLSLEPVGDAVEPGSGARRGRSRPPRRSATRWPNCCGRAAQALPVVGEDGADLGKVTRRRAWSSARRGRNEALAADAASAGRAGAALGVPRRAAMVRAGASSR